MARKSITELAGYHGKHGQHHVIDRGVLEFWVTVQPDYMVEEGAWRYTVTAWRGDDARPYAYRQGADWLDDLEKLFTALVNTVEKVN